MAREKFNAKDTGPKDKPDDLSIAIELKFLIPLLPRNNCYSGKEGQRKPEVVGFVETAKGLRDEDKLQLWRHAFSNIASVIETVPGQQALTSYEISDIGMKERDCWSTHWVVKRSMSAEPAKDHPHRNDWLWVPTEVNSPKMSWKDPTTLQIISSVMDGIKKRYIVMSNYTCEVHVHVGRLDGRPFSLPTLKKLAMLSWAAEPALRKVKDPRSPNFAHTYTWSNSAREYSRLATDVGAGKGAHLLRTDDLERLPRAIKRYLASPHPAGNAEINALRLITKTQSSMHLGRLMSGEGRPYRRLGFNFSAFGGEDERSRTNPRTVECRFLEGIMETNIVVAWIHIIGKMTEVALDGVADSGEHFSRIALYRARSEENGSAQDLTFCKLMRRLQINEDVYHPVQALILGIHGKMP